MLIGTDVRLSSDGAARHVCEGPIDLRDSGESVGNDQFAAATRETSTTATVVALLNR